VLAWNSQPGWTYRLQTSTNLTTWHDLTTREGAAWQMQFIHTNGGDASPRFWRIQCREGAFPPE